jgi:hypothetical protein
MRKKLTIYLGLVLLALLVTVLLAWFMPQAEPPLRKGMTEPDVEAALGVKGSLIGLGRHQSTGEHSVPTDRLGNGLTTRRGVTKLKGVYSVPPDWLGNGATVWVSFDEAGQADHWEVQSLPRTRPPWLDTALKWAGW